MSKLVRVLVVDDSPTVRALLSGAINAARDMQVIGEAVSGRQAIRMTEELRPDVVLMDIVMPDLDGVEATREIMARTPTPIVVISASLDRHQTDIAFQAMSAGALNVQPKPGNMRDPAYAGQMAGLLNTLRAMSEVKVIHHRRRFQPDPPPAPLAAPDIPVQIAGTPEIVGIVSSTGGPAALHSLLRVLPADFALPVVIVQHIAPDFTASLVDWLGRVISLPVMEARPNETPRPGTVYLAPGGGHLTLTSGRRFAQVEEPRNHPHIPSGDVLLDSLARSYGPHGVGIVLTGMGRDGASGLHAMAGAGALTLAQDEASSVVYGMPREAAALGAARYILPPIEIARVLADLSRKLQAEKRTP